MVFAAIFSDELPVLPVRKGSDVNTVSTTDASPKPRTASDASTVEVEVVNEDLAKVIATYKKTDDLKVGAAFSMAAAVAKPEQAGAALLAVVLKRNKAVPDVEAILARLRKASSITDSALPGYLYLVKAYALRGRFQAAEELVAELRAAQVWVGSVVALLFELAVKESKFESAWTYLEEALATGGRVHKVSVSLLLKRRPTSAGLELVEKFIQLQPADADEVLFNSLLDACSRVHEHDTVRMDRVLATMQAYGQPRSAATYGTLLKTFGARGDGEAVRATWLELKGAMVEMNAVTYGCMLDSAVRCKLYDLADQVWEDLEATGLQPNTILYSTMIKKAVAQRDLPRSIALKERMFAQNVPMNIVTYNSLVDVAVRCRSWQTAMALLAEMKVAGVEPDLITYSTLIKGLCEMGKLQDALALFGHLEQEGITVDKILFHSLLDGCVRAKAEPAVAVSLLQSMRARGFEPSAAILTAAFKVFALHGQLEAGLDMAFCSDYVSPAVITAAVRACVQSEQAEEAAALLIRLAHNGQWPSPQQLAVVLPGLFAQQNMAALCELFFVVIHGPRLPQSQTDTLLLYVERFVQLARGDYEMQAAAAQILQGAVGVGLCTKAQVQRLEIDLFSELRADAPVFVPSAGLEDENREPLSPVRASGHVRTSSGLLQDENDGKNVHGENASPNVRKAKKDALFVSA
jgi:pentatricopeptide repeat protein